MAREQFQTLTESMYYILLSLIRPMHGYEIMQNVKTITENKVIVGAGTLYALLLRFENEKIVRQLDSDGRRKVYVLTEKGRELLDKEYARLKQSISAYDMYINNKELEL